MAFNPRPDTWLANWSEDGTDISVPLATFPELTAAEADGATGDIREILFAVCEKLWSEWTSRESDDRPSMFTIAKNVQTNVNTGQETKTFVLRFVTEVEVGGRSVVAEP